MNSLAAEYQSVTASSVAVTDEELQVVLSDGRKLTVPIGWFPRLSHGSEIERNTFEIIGLGSGIHWSILDEDISVNGLLKGFGSGESQNSLNTWLEARVAKS